MAQVPRKSDFLGVDGDFFQPNLLKFLDLSLFPFFLFDAFSPSVSHLVATPDNDDNDDNDNDNDNLNPAVVLCLLLLNPRRATKHQRVSPQSLPGTMPTVRSRRSLSSILVPAFLQPSHIDIANDQDPSFAPFDEDAPPAFLLDEDPFANLSSPRSAIPLSPPLSPTSTPLPGRSPLSPVAESRVTFPPTLPPILVSRASSNRVRPAYQKPAFPPRPSLPSLNTLASMNVVLPKKVRKGRPGAGLPFEPWDCLPPTANSPSPITESPSESEDTIPTSPPSPPLPPVITAPSPSSHDFVADLDLDCLKFLDFSNDPCHPETPLPTSDDGCLSPPPENLEQFLHEEYLPALLLASPTQPPLARSKSSSTKSTSSSDSVQSDYWSCTSRTNTSTSPSSAEESDLPNSPDGQSGCTKIFSSINPETETTEIYDNLFFSQPDDAFFEPGTSADTLRPPVDFRAWKFPTMTSPTGTQAEQPMDTDAQHRGQNQRNFRTGEDSGSTGNRGRPGGGTGNNGGGQRGISGSGGNDDGDDEKRRFNRIPAFSPSSDSETSATEDADEDSADGHAHDTRPAGSAQKPGPSANAQSTNPKPASGSSDDDVPLAQRIPTALKVQKTIREQVKLEKEQRRKARANKMAEQSAAVSSTPQSMFRRLLSVGGSAHATPVRKSHEESSSRSFAGRPRTKTLPGNQSRPFSPQDLTRKLRELDTTAKLPVPRHHQSLSSSPSKKDGDRPSRTPSRPATAQPLLTQSVSPSRSPRGQFSTLNRMRSFHKVSPERSNLEEHRSIPLPSDTEQKLVRSMSRSENHSVGPRTPSVSRKSGERSTRSSAETDRHPRPSVHQQRPPVPPLPASEVLTTSSQAQRSPGYPIVQQRVFIGDMQRFNTVEIGPTTKALDVIEMVEAQGSLKGWVGSGDWMLWEVAQDFGLERPIRSYEVLADVQASWNKDKMMNAFVLKLTPLATPLSLAAMPTASPIYAGYVEWESKRGKWSKRWLQLREHSLWISKRDNGRDETLLCSLSNFDAYFITRTCKAPRPFTFTIKSTDNLSFFENTADYMHTFSCTEKEGHTWMEKILLARSYVLHQEKNVLFSPKVSSGVLSRSITRKSSSAHRTAQPLVNVAPPHAPQNPNDIFEPGSLLSRHS